METTLLVNTMIIVVGMATGEHLLWLRVNWKLDFFTVNIFTLIRLGELSAG